MVACQRAGKRPPSRSRIAGGLAILLASGLVLAGCGGETARWTYAPTLAPAPSARPSATPAASPTAAASQAASPAATPGASQAAPGEVLATLEISGVDLGFEPMAFTVDQPGRYEIRLVNRGSTTHVVTFPDGTTISAEPGQTVPGVVEVPAGGVSFLCSIPGNAAAGMTGSISIKGTAGNGGGDGGSGAGPGPTPGSQPDPGAPAYVPRDPRAPARLAGTVHDIDLVIVERTMTVAEGYVQAVWTFGGQVPGPVIRVSVGDTVRVHLRNPATNTQSHSIAFQGSMAAWNDEMTSISPGEEKLYTWKARYAGVWMYYGGTAPALHQIANGMYGMVIVEPKAGLSKVSQELFLVQSEWYLGPQGEPASLAKAAAGAPSPDFVVFNGVADQYSDNPIQVATGKRVRIFVLDAGPNLGSSFHVVGTVFDRVIKEGVELKVGNSGPWASQAVDLSPGQGAIVELTPAEDGLYPFITHAFTHVGRGALGLLKAGDGDPKN
jgi:nitrite reductase (NO-forming)